MPSNGGFLTDPEQSKAVEKAIIKHFDEIVELAESGEPPIKALVSELDGLGGDGAYWRLADRCIGYALESKFTRVGRVSVGYPLLPRAAIYQAKRVDE